MYRLKVVPWMAMLMATGVAVAQSSGNSTQQKSDDLSVTAASAITAWKDDSGVQNVSATNVTVTYAYDSLGRLIQESYPANNGGYIYDAAGNRIQADTR